MKTTATNRKLRVLLTSIRNKTLIPDPEFQRRLVWNSKDKRRFLDTVLKGYPFPEIYIAAGTVDPKTGEGTELLVDGQQRMTTLYQYFTGARELRLAGEIAPYKRLSEDEQIAFLEYEVVVRDLGKLSIDEIKRVFERINATSYSLNAMEVHNARYQGEFKTFAETVSQLPFFERHRVFSANEIRRMRDVSFALVLIITVMSSYFNREDELVPYLENFNDEFEMKEDIRQKLTRVFAFIEECGFDNSSRVWNLPDLLSLVVELYRILGLSDRQLSVDEARARLAIFYDNVNAYIQGNAQLSEHETRDVAEYARAASQATNDRGSRIRRGEIVRQVLLDGLG